MQKYWYALEPSTQLGKKLMVIKKDAAGNHLKTIHFGDSLHSDYTIHKDPARKKLYIMRHEKNENWKNPDTAGFWARWLLWNKPSLKDSIAWVKKNLGIMIKQYRMNEYYYKFPQSFLRKNGMKPP